MKQVIGSIQKNNVKIIEYNEGTFNYSDTYFVQSGAVGFWATKKELSDLSIVLNYYLNIENFTECEVIVDGNKLAIQ